jgi:hypothetical protein
LIFPAQYLPTGVREGDSARCIPQSYQLPLVASTSIQRVVPLLPCPHSIRDVVVVEGERPRQGWSFVVNG